MRNGGWIVVAACAATLGGCAGRADKPPTSVEAPAETAIPARSGWRAYVTSGDRGRLMRTRNAWDQALAQARDAGHGEALTTLGALTDPDAALDGPEPPPGRYKCRTVKIGAKQQGLPDFTPYGWFDCGILREDDHLLLVKESGSQRPSGRLYFDTTRRMVFLGTMVLGDEKKAIPYGVDSERNMVGAFERIGERRWRLVLPWPNWESNLDLIELEPDLAPPIAR